MVLDQTVDQSVETNDAADKADGLQTVEPIAPVVSHRLDDPMDSCGRFDQLRVGRHLLSMTRSSAAEKAGDARALMGRGVRL